MLGSVLKISAVVGAVVGGFLLWDGTIGYFISDCTPRSPTSRARSDMRSLATAIETYKVDYKVYPPSTTNMEITPMRDLARKHPRGEWEIPTLTGAITTPIAYVTSIFPDAYGKERGRSYQYFLHPSGDGWITWSPGPDGKYQLDWTVYDPAVPQPSLELITGAGPEGAYTYDPSNGTISPGVLWRVKQ